MSWDLPWKVVPSQRWPGPLTRKRQRSRFRASWTDTVNLLERELRHLRARDVLLQMPITRDEIRLDGKPRANARPEHPGVILTFESRKLDTTLSYPADRFDDWQDNIRAIALSLEALRKVDRYGVTRRGEQYTGWGQLPPAGGTTTAEMTARTAAEVLVDAEEMDGDPEDLLIDHQAVRWTYQNAAKKTHPDRHGGSTERFQIVAAAKKVLDEHHVVAGAHG